MRQRSWRRHVVAVAVMGSSLATLSWAQGHSSVQEYWGPRYSYPEPLNTLTLSRQTAPGPFASQVTQTAFTGASERLHHWNGVALDASGLDHTPVTAGESRVFGEQLGPGRASRALAIVHIAVFDAVNAIVGGYTSYTVMPKARPDASVEAAIGQAAHDTLVAMFPSQTERCDQELAEDLARIPDGQAKSDGIAVGRRAAANILNKRAIDDSQSPEPVLGADFFTKDRPGKWRQDPISLVPIALGGWWSYVKTFAIPSSTYFRVPPPPALNSPQYATAYNEVQRLGGDGINTPTDRTEEQTFIGTFWAYDGTPSLCAPPRLYNQIALTIAYEMGTVDVVDLARLLALVNVSMADAGIASWESKYFYQFWRPITGIRESDIGTGPTGRGDGNAATLGDPGFVPLGAPASNLHGPNFTPPFPAYPSGHATIGGALFQTLRNFYGRDDIAFTFVSDEYNGQTRDNTGVVRPWIPRTFDTLSQAEEENGQSRIYLGIHWSFDKTAGIAQGRLVANHVFQNLFRRTAAD